MLKKLIEDFEKIISYIRDELENYVAANNLIDSIEKLKNI